MANPLADLQNQISDTLKRYQHRVDYLAIRLEASEGTDIFLRGIQKTPPRRPSHRNPQRRCQLGGASAGLL